jgi:hypothetical protein
MGKCTSPVTDVFGVLARFGNVDTFSFVTVIWYVLDEAPVSQFIKEDRR